MSRGSRAGSREVHANSASTPPVDDRHRVMVSSNSQRHAHARLGTGLVVLACIGGILASTGCRGWRSNAPVCLAGARMSASGSCRPQRSPTHAIPFRPGYETEVMQAYHGYRTHKDDIAYSIDFKCEPGTPIVASRDGIVWDIHETSNRGCNDPSCIDDGNYVALDHGNGSFTEYHHLQQFGALVEVGEQVCRGQVIGLCGNTGYSSGPHLHFALTNAAHRTIPSRLPDGDRPRFPVAIPETSYVSDNELDAPCPETSYSRLPPDAFAHHGIMLERSIPLVVEIDESSNRLAGTYYGDHPKVAIHRKPVDRGEWSDRCLSTDEQGRFETTLRWPDSEYDAGFHWIIMTGADSDCLSPGWAWSYKVRVDT